jgi:GR25 family glycosyltransferase involved in LPS biosynthesis
MKAYIIHLSKIESSLKSAQRLKKELESFGTEAELFEGSYGNETIVEYKEQGREHHPWTFKGPNNPVSDEFKKRQTTPGLLGCFDSHYRLWEKCVELGEPIMIFEDDAHIYRPYQPVEWEEVLSLVFSHRKKMNKYIQYLESPYGDPRAMNYRPSSMPGNAGYAIKPKAAAKLVNMYKHSFLPADNAINQHVVKIQIHNYMMGKAEPREKTANRSSLIRTNYWNEI